MTDPIEAGARAAAQRLTTARTPSLTADVEAALHARGTAARPGRYLDPVALGSLVVAAATLAWAVVKDLRKQTPEPSPEVVTRIVRIQLEGTEAALASLTPEERQRVIGIVVAETLDAAATGDAATGDAATGGTPDAGAADPGA
ncbi:hypothetical protein ACFXAF_28745 [Kitasatospora sp. NPDC059463]|uniref:hypothetical protein n=1 Tax=unclassified Kitasatospora TaxID=2633591 RepID=UPI0036A12A72